MTSNAPPGAGELPELSPPHAASESAIAVPRSIANERLPADLRHILFFLIPWVIALPRFGSTANAP